MGHGCGGFVRIGATTFWKTFDMKCIGAITLDPYLVMFFPVWISIDSGKGVL